MKVIYFYIYGIADLFKDLIAIYSRFVQFACSAINGVQQMFCVRYYILSFALRKPLIYCFIIKAMTSCIKYLPVSKVLKTEWT